MSVVMEGRPVLQFHEPEPLSTTTTSSTLPLEGTDGEEPLPTIDPSTGSTLLPQPGRGPSRPPPGGSSTTSTTKGNDPAIVRVPNVVGRYVLDAIEALHDAGFSVQRRTTRANVEPGTVVSQTPPGGSLATAGSTVTITVAS
jgi:serine/threonine-protein kinase